MNILKSDMNILNIWLPPWSAVDWANWKSTSYTHGPRSRIVNEKNEIRSFYFAATAVRGPIVDEYIKEWYEYIKDLTATAVRGPVVEEYIKK